MSEQIPTQMNENMQKAEKLVQQFIDLLGEYEFTRPTDMVIIKLQEALMWANAAMLDKNKKKIIQEAV